MRLYIPKEDSEGWALWNERKETEESIARKRREIGSLQHRRREIDKKLEHHLMIVVTPA